MESVCLSCRTPIETIMKTRRSLAVEIGLAFVIVLGALLFWPLIVVGVITFAIYFLVRPKFPACPLCGSENPVSIHSIEAKNALKR